MQGSRTDFPDGSTKSARGPMPVIAGYGSFDEMTQACCCIESANPSVAFNTTERWICPGQQVVVDRGRVGFDLVDNGLPIRPICGGSPDVRFGCAITVNSTGDGERVMLTCPTAITPDQWRQLGVSNDALFVLF
jgi:hypothetical protein